MRASGLESITPRKSVFLIRTRTLAVTPSGSRGLDFADVTTICHDYTVNGIENMLMHAGKPFRFIYTSGVLIERDQSKALTILGDYRHMRVCSIHIYPLLPNLLG